MPEYASYGFPIKDEDAQASVNLLSWISDIMESRGMGSLIDIDFEKMEERDSLIHWDFKRPNFLQYFFPKMAFRIRKSWEARQYRKARPDA